MFREEWKNKPKCGYFYLLGTCGKPILWKHHKDDHDAQNITAMSVTVYNTNTQRVSDKSVYLAKDGRLYINARRSWQSKSCRIYLDEFKTEEE